MTDLKACVTCGGIPVFANTSDGDLCKECWDKVPKKLNPNQAGLKVMMDVFMMAITAVVIGFTSFLSGIVYFVYWIFS